MPKQPKKQAADKIIQEVQPPMQESVTAQAMPSIEQIQADMVVIQSNKIGNGIASLLQHMEIPYPIGYMALSPILCGALIEMTKQRQQGVLGQVIRKQMQVLMAHLNAYLEEPRTHQEEAVVKE